MGISQIRFQACQMGYGRTPVVLIDNLSLETGLIYCVFGRNGSGKTTILKSISGLIPPVDGKVFIEEIEVQKMDQ
ncbi:MAG TPA: iron ABC transporter ATP-binding protein, partial [Flavobacteriales bacterium]|nr:iron ABC transporter ATP-binding protein [Flavobacteriales bacterium]